jgi:hypothetical protein
VLSVFTGQSPLLWHTERAKSLGKLSWAGHSAQARETVGASPGPRLSPSMPQSTGRMQKLAEQLSSQRLPGGQLFPFSHFRTRRHDYDQI